ncbi:hypothetical protein BKA62DRAFT_743242 [Auriculariales sp. MPI-PUGE-AT-0066]|nr:hypothetical protein BKA62DRAFT_743242 [Auriculariales sp. MPI-PUGE-AT-0066]
MTTPVQPPPQQQQQQQQQPSLRRRSSRDQVPVRNGHANGHTNGHVNGNGVLAKIGEVHSDEDAASAPTSHAQNGSAAETKPIDWEVPRKTLHSSIGFLVVPLYTSHHPVNKVIFGLALALVFVASNDLVRFNWPWFAQTYERVVGFLMRDSEKQKINGVVWYLVGVLFALINFPLDIAVVSILTLSWADTSASTFGRMFGRRTRQLPTSFPLPGTGLRLPLFAPKKSVAGFTAAVVTGAIITGGFYGAVAPLGVDAPSWQLGKGLLGSWPGLALLTAVGGLTAGVAEALYVGPLDDNLTLPIITGATLCAFFALERFVAGWLF